MTTETLALTAHGPRHGSFVAILAGVLTTLVIQLLLNLLGVGIGLSSFNVADTSANPTASGFSIGAAIWWVASGLIATFIGGVAAGRLCGSASANAARWHGFVAWAATTLILAWLITSAIGGIVGGTFSALGSTISGIGKTAASAVSGAADAAGANGGGLEAQMRALVDPNDKQVLQTNVTDYLRASISGDQKAADEAKNKAADSLAKAANISPDDARKRLDDAAAQAKQAADVAKQKATDAAEATRKGAAQGGIYGAVALLLGALAGWLGGGAGTPRRSEA